MYQVFITKACLPTQQKAMAFQNSFIRHACFDFLEATWNPMAKFVDKAPWYPEENVLPVLLDNYENHY